MPTITKMTPEDLTAIGVKKPTHRKKLKADIVKLTIADGLPNYIPPTLDEFLHLVRLMEYRGLLANQGYLTIDDLTQISIEDLEDIGISIESIWSTVYFLCHIWVILVSF